MPASVWQDECHYAVLRHAERRAFAWEWLRRNPEYRRQAMLTRDGSIVFDPRDWQLHAFVAPDEATPIARPVWMATPARPVLRVHAEASADDRSFNLAVYADLATLIRSKSFEHLLLSDGLRSIRLDIVAGSLLQGPVLLHYVLAGVAVHDELAALGDFLYLCRTGCFPRLPTSSSARTRRLILLLRAFDGLMAGANHRELAAVLLDQQALQPQWRNERPSLRSQVQRLARTAREMSLNYRIFL